MKKRQPAISPADPAATTNSNTNHGIAATPTMPSLLLAVDIPATEFDEQRQAAYLMLLARGASPAAACGQLGLSLVTVADFMEHHAGFCSLLARVKDLLSQNVAAALYRSAMEGSVSAQTFYLKNRPPPEWPEMNADPLSQPLDELTDDELIAQFRQEAPALLAQLATENSPAAGTAASGSVSQSTQTSGGN